MFAPRPGTVFVSRTNPPKTELLKIKSYRAPRDKIICVLNCCKVIFGTLISLAPSLDSSPPPLFTLANLSYRASQAFQVGFVCGFFHAHAHLCCSSSEPRALGLQCAIHSPISESRETGWRSRLLSVVAGKWPMTSIAHHDSSDILTS